jgi:hypothetical protein
MKDQEATGSAAPQSLPPPPLPPQTTGVSASTGQRATSSVVPLVREENGVIGGEFLWPRCSPCNDMLMALQFLENDGVDVQKLDPSLNRYAIKLTNILHPLSE